MITLKGIQDKLIGIEPKRDLLHELLGCGLFAEITKTSDGVYLGQAKGDIGFNAFLGIPSAIAFERTKKYLSLFFPEEKKWIIAYVNRKYGEILR